MIKKPNTRAGGGQGRKTMTERAMEQMQALGILSSEGTGEEEGRKERGHYGDKRKVEGREKAEILLCPLSG